MTYKSIVEFQEKYRSEEERVEALKEMTQEEANALVDDCCTESEKAYYRDLYTISQILKADIPESELDYFDWKWSKAEYRGRVIYSLMHYMSRPEFRDNYTQTVERIKLEQRYFEWAYEHKESPNDAAIEIGYGCG